MTTFPTCSRAAVLLTAGAVLGACAPRAAAPVSSPAAPPAAAAATAPGRAIRRDIPITNAIRRAYAAGTRDSTGRPGRNYWQLRTDYTIEARLDTASSRLHGRETVVIHNGSRDTLKQVVLRLDPNIFIGNTPQLAPWVPAEITDGMLITKLSVNGADADVSASTPLPTAQGARALASSANAPAGALAVNGLRTTRATVGLASPILPGQQATLVIEWNHKLPGGPGVGHRMTQRWADTLYQPTQWYPRVAVYDDLRGWDPELYLGPSEFYNNFGRFDVTLDVPAGWVASGTGVLQNAAEVLTPAARARLARATESDTIVTVVGPRGAGPGDGLAPVSGARQRWHFVADTVNDFAWATARSYQWKATRATIPGKGAVPVHLVYLPGRANLYANAGPIARHALEFYSSLWFPYQFPQLTLQDGPSAGMEYPMVINSNQGAADHETGHQWWPMVVSNNETWYGWMDEGFNQYMNVLSDADAAGKAPSFDRMGQDYGRLVSGEEAEPPMMWNANYAGPRFYGFTTYSKTPMVLSMLGGIVSDSAVQRAIREYSRDWMFRLPSPWDFMFSMNRLLGRDLGWFWYYWLFTTERVDGSITGVEREGDRTVVTVRQDGQMPSPVVLRVQFAPGGGPIRTLPNMRMENETTAIITWPVDVWFGGSRTYRAAIDAGRAVEKVTLDPFGRFPDKDPGDNRWPRP
ncbi:MAG TPA: M1 family metallopeptidase [Gemmatimonadaceae bacterium]